MIIFGGKDYEPSLFWYTDGCQWHDGTHLSQ